MRTNDFNCLAAADKKTQFYAFDPRLLSNGIATADRTNWYNGNILTYLEVLGSNLG